jgi:uncharacterized protein with FMN-binding domain
VSKTGGKGRISNELVAASCAAVLTVYAAGYWRTREAARRLETQAQERRPARPASPPVVVAAIAPPIEAPAPTPAPEPLPEPPVAVVEAAPDPVEPPPAPVVEEAKPAKKLVAKKSAPPPPPPEETAAATAAVAPPAILSIPLEPPPKDWSTPPPSLDSVPVPATGWRDGTYTGWGTSNHGDIEARVLIENGRIAGSGIATCATRYPCDVIYTIIFQPVWTQSPEVDRVSRATESADAYYYGLVEALKKASAAPAATTTAPQ